MNPFLAKKKQPFDATNLGIAVNTIKGIPQAFADVVGKPSLRAYAGVGSEISKLAGGEAFTPSTPFQKDLYGTDKPITLGSVGAEYGLKPDNKFAPVLGLAAGVSDLIPGGSEVKVTAAKALENARLYKSFLEDALAGHPGAGLMKYRSAATGELPEISSKAGKGKFNLGGDKIIQDVVGAEASGGGDIMKANRDLTSYVKLRNQLKVVEEDIKRMDSVAKEAQPPALSKAEVKSLSKLEEQSLSRETVPPTEGLSLPKTIAQPATAGEKVNVLDYFRTPDRVLSKIGFNNESKLVRQGYEGYVKELPKNIDRITQWSKEVPKESAKTIFQYLDGEKVALSPQETKVAGEMKTWLSQWADRLHLPQDSRISNYITHIFDKGLQGKEFDENLAKIITDKIPGSVYDPFTLERLGARGYKQNVFEALDAYVKTATRKVHMDEALKAIQEKAGSSLERSKIEASQFKYLQRYVSGINMRPTELDNLLDNGIKAAVGYKFGARPVTYLTKLLRQLTYRGLLGLNPGSALRNISQGINTYATLGEKYTALGYIKLLGKGAMKELSDEGVFAPGFIQDRNLSSTKKAMERIDKGLFAFFEAAERVNRGAAYYGAKSKALAEGKGAQEAIDYAKSIVRKTQFSFGSVDTPVALQSDIAKTIAQFQNYTLKQTEFLAEMVKDKNFVGLLRYAVAGTGFVYTVGKAFGMQPKDLIPTYRFDTPPSLKLPVETGKALLNTPDKYGKPRDLGTKVSDVANSAVGLIPGGSQIKKSVQGLQAYTKGKDTTATGRTRYTIPQDTEHFLQAILFGKNALPEAQAYYNKSSTPSAKKSNPFLK